MNVQMLIVSLLVPACGAYAAWTLMPTAARRALASRLLRLPLPAFCTAALAAAVKPASSSCGCSGCDRGAIPERREQTLHFHPRAKP